MGNDKPSPVSIELESLRALVLRGTKEIGQRFVGGSGLCQGNLPNIDFALS
jgi:hypothetical protein